jgi:secreted trypsin-like serine protease
MRRAVLLMATVALALVLAGGATQAIINGEPDRNRHPYVGMVYNDESLCSGTLISPTVFLTAAHCTEFFEQEGSQVWVTFESRADFEPDDAFTGTPYTHPAYNPQAGANAPDVGVVVLDEPLSMDAYGQLPRAGIVEGFEAGQTLTLVGYGVRDFEVGGGPPRPTDVATRYKANVKFTGTRGLGNAAGKDVYLKYKGASAGQGGEGGCFGDSGGAHFLPGTRTVVAVESFGPSPLCAGAGYAQRVDLPVVLRWVRSFL